jgi:phospholipid/cholesterol/gamma-HCH transport system substrate-binding protein
MANAAKVGIFVVIFGLLLVAAYSVVGKSLFASQKAAYFVEFEDASGVTPGSPIHMAGVKVGQVDAVKLASPRLARLKISIDPYVKLPEGTTAEVPTSFIGFGDQPIQLKAPIGVASFLSEGATLRGRKAGPLEGILPDTTETFKEINATLKEVRTLIADPKLKADVKQLVASSEKTISSFGKLADRMDGVVMQNERSLQLALTRGASAVADVQRVTAAIARLVEDGKLQKDAKAIVAQLIETSKKADALVGNMNSLVADPSIKASMSSFAEITESGKRIANNVEDITDTSKLLARDAAQMSANGVTISANVADLTERSKKVIDGAAEIEEKVKDLLEKLEGAVGPAGRPSIPTVTSTMDILRETEPGKYRTDFNARLQLNPVNTLDIGLWDAFEGNRLTVQYGTRIDPKLSYRYGVFAGKPGLGVDYAVTSRLFLRNDVWDLNNPRYDARLRAEFGGGLYGWIGSERIFSKNSPVFGIGIRK